MIATSASLFSICASAGLVGIRESSLESGGNTVNVTGASNFNGGAKKDRETVTIAAVDASGPITDAKCTLTNAKGDWSVTAPDSVEVRRSDSDLQIRCEKPGYDPVVGSIKASTTEIPRPKFHFGTDAGGDGDDDDAMITVPQYAASITVTFGAKQANAN